VATLESEILCDEQLEQSEKYQKPQNAPANEVVVELADHECGLATRHAENMVLLPHICQSKADCSTIE
jgi:hypothetical protein